MIKVSVFPKISAMTELLSYKKKLQNIIDIAQISIGKPELTLQGVFFRTKLRT